MSNNLCADAIQESRSRRLTLSSPNPVVVPSIAPIELLRPNSEMDGSVGTNRAVGNRPQIAAQTDIDALKVWLARYADTRATFDSYRRESERLLLWTTIELRKPLSSLTHEDMLMYQRFLADPQPASRWVLPTKRKLSRFDPDWRPFAGPLSPISQRQAIIILNGMFAWLVNAGYLAGNPLSLSRQRHRKAKPRITRYLDHDLWNEVKVTIELMPKETDRQREHYFRVRWLYSLFYIGGLRISEVIGNTMGGFFGRKDKDGEDRWWLEITGKGGKTRLIPATSELMVELARYRREAGLSPLPFPNDTTPLLLPIGGNHRALTRSALHQIVKAVFEMAAERLQAKGDEFDGRAQMVRSASAHWMRHTGGTHMLDQGVSLLNVRDNLGHGSIATTNQYAHTEEDKRHAELEQKHRVGWRRLAIWPARPLAFSSSSALTNSMVEKNRTRLPCLRSASTPMAVARCVLPVPGPPISTMFCAAFTKAHWCKSRTKVSSTFAAWKSNPAKSRCMGKRAAPI